MEVSGYPSYTSEAGHAMAEVPKEVWALVFTFVEDVDLQTLARVCRLFHILATDRILWKIYLASRNRRRVSSRLFHMPQRPSRRDLVALNILRTTPFRENNGTTYVNSPVRVAHWVAQQSIRKLFIYKSLGKSLRDRPSVEELALRNVIPMADVRCQGTVSRSGSDVGDGLGAPCSPKLMTRALKLNKALKEDKLRKSLRSRITVEDLRKMGVAKTHQVMKYCAYHPTMLATQVELDKRLTSSRIFTSLNHRPTVESLECMKVLRTSPTTAAMLCPNIKPKLRFFEDLSACSAVSAEVA
ncbi:uncharacterized protein EV422DRAFT_519584 [Fimicolochytrium jonesii]|uniref:uncharacterized protein n=1 Tax=Fimicolochytrium jonesii TaxID=1396493 RepID=UPI0022FF4584|nr:uncharacterized protein EV422DRAFT_519584 [Fimicolochytrium jonesii]KAI8824283.1 hypothetical protein EV422DRAFT_519584 [Fimicolochytrium jonesii]